MSLLRRMKPAKKTISDTIAELLAPQPLLDPEIDGADETVAQTRTYGDDDDDDELGEIDPRMSDIRKRNVKLLQDVDRKYSGKISSRKDFEVEEEDEEDDDDDDDDEEEVAYEDSSEDEVVDKKRSKAAVDTDSDSEDGVEDEEVDDEEEDDEAEAENDEDDEEDDDDAAEDDEDDDDDDSASDFDDNADIDLAPKSSATAASPAAVRDSTRTVRPANVSADLQKGHCVQNQLHIWEKLLEMRIHSQKILINANTLPAHTQLNAMASQSSQLSDAVAATGRTVSTLLDRLTELQTQLVAKFPETAGLNPRKRRHDDDADGDVREDAASRRIRRHGEHLTERHEAYTEYRNAVLLKWYDRTKVLTPGTREGRHAAQHNVLQNIDAILANRAELVRKTQLHKGGYTIIGGPAAVAVQERQDIDAAAFDEGGQRAEDQEAAKEELYAPEIYDDSDFYHTQLRELIEFKANAAATPDEMNRQFVELQKLRKKMKKQVDTRASKGRKIRYVVHNKMVNFMARNEASDWTEEAKTELYSSLFGARLGGES